MLCLDGECIYATLDISVMEWRLILEVCEALPPRRTSSALPFKHFCFGSVDQSTIRYLQMTLSISFLIHVIKKMLGMRQINKTSEAWRASHAKNHSTIQKLFSVLNIPGSHLYWTAFFSSYRPISNTSLRVISTFSYWEISLRSNTTRFRPVWSVSSSTQESATDRYSTFSAPATNKV